MDRQLLQKTFLTRHFNNQDGVVLVTTLLIMVVLAIMGAASMTIRNTGQSIILNTEVFQHNFYVVESITLEGAAAIEGTDDTTLSDPPSFPTWLKEAGPPIDLSLSSQWPSGAILPSETSMNVGAVNITPPGYASDGTTSGDRIWYAATDNGPCGGGSLTNPGQVEQCYDVYGMYDVKAGAGKAYHGKMMLNVGYKKVLFTTP